ncbi:MAG TPA: prepilin-type N-terminal cleavage/methylation domain-containing protein [Candidatus Paceibacterota bacterium]|jgi:type II secretory pathway pseudopilin PulG|nr:prepilin-type N-terminal cleavage/methylation domain-containing protein [Candidatus Paceibacterota bacterium]
MLISSRICRYFSKLLRPQRGFTIIELLVVSFIMILITTTILFRQQGFSSSTLLRSLAYSVALSVRQAQVYGVSVREQTNASTGLGTGVFAQGYGVKFSNSGCSLNNKSRYQLFADIDGDGVLDSGEELPCYTVGNGRETDYKISNFCAHVILSGATVCVVPNPPAITWLNVYFRRPNPDACFATSVEPDACASATAQTKYDYAYIQLQSQGSSDTRTVKVTSTGQIAVCKLNTDPAAC